MSSSKRRKTADTIMEVLIMYFEAIARVIADRTGCEVSAVKPESTFTELGIDSLDTVELLMNLEDELGIEIELDQPVATVGDLDKFIQSKQG
ncbi:MAG: acyl carrier protein [Faecousia sp.]